MDDRHEKLRTARLWLVADAETCREGTAEQRPMSHDGWAERADASAAGQLVGPLEIEAIASLVFGRRRLRRIG